MITSDSLAAESLRDGGNFASGDAAASSQPSKSTTTNTTDTSGASVLEPASDKTERPTAEVEGTSYGNAGAEAGSSKSADKSYSTSGNAASDTTKSGDAPTYAQSASGGNAANFQE